MLPINRQWIGSGDQSVIGDNRWFRSKGKFTDPIGASDQPAVQYAHLRPFWGIDFHSAEGIISYCYDNKYIVMLVNNYKANI